MFSNASHPSSAVPKQVTLLTKEKSPWQPSQPACASNDNQFKRVIRLWQAVGQFIFCVNLGRLLGVLFIVIRCDSTAHFPVPFDSGVLVLASLESMKVIGFFFFFTSSASRYVLLRPHWRRRRIILSHHLIPFHHIMSFRFQREN
jgi:hypothetical protein